MVFSEFTLYSTLILTEDAFYMRVCAWALSSYPQELRMLTCSPSFLNLESLLRDFQSICWNWDPCKTTSFKKLKKVVYMSPLQKYSTGAIKMNQNPKLLITHIGNGFQNTSRTEEFKKWEILQVFQIFHMFYVLGEISRYIAVAQ